MLHIGLYLRNLRLEKSSVRVGLIKCECISAELIRLIYISDLHCKARRIQQTLQSQLSGVFKNCTFCSGSFELSYSPHATKSFAVHPNSLAHCFSIIPLLPC